MKKIINGKMYNTETAELIFRHETHDGYFGGNPSTKGERYSEIFRKKTGEFFEIVWTKLYFQENFRCEVLPMDENVARLELEDLLDVDRYESIFGKVEE